MTRLVSVMSGRLTVNKTTRRDVAWIQERLLHYTLIMALSALRATTRAYPQLHTSKHAQYNLLVAVTCMQPSCLLEKKCHAQDNSPTRYGYKKVK